MKTLFAIFAVLIFCGCTHYTARIYNGKSMLPTIPIGTRIVADKKPIEISRGDIVLFNFPDVLQSKKDALSRVVAIEGDTVSIHGPDLLVNGSPINYAGTSNNYTVSSDSYVFLSPPPKKTAISSGPIHITAGYVFIAGDNPSQSLDSRYWGPLPISNIIGVVSNEE